jgi:UPF0755 protein
MAADRHKDNPDSAAMSRTNQISRKIIEISLRVLGISVLAMVLYKGTTTAYSYGYAIFNDTPMEEAPGTDITVTIDKNTSTREIGKLLESQGLVENGFVFYLQTKMIEKGSQIKAGRYELNTSMTAEKMISIMSAEEQGDAEDGE